MERCRRSRIPASRLGFGCAAIGGYDYGAVRDDESILAVQRALDAGITLFDTADVYGLGHAEQILGRGLGRRRPEVIIATKVGVRWDDGGRTVRDLTPAYLESALEASLRRLGVDCISLYQMHWPDPRTPIDATLETLDRFRQHGKIRWIGCCNVDIAAIDRAQRACRVDAVQLPFSLVDRAHETTLQHAHATHGMLVTVYNALAQGLLTGKYDAASRFGSDDLRSRSDLFHGPRLEDGLEALARVRVLAARRGRTPAQIALRWAAEQPFVDAVLAGMKTPAQVDENRSAFGWDVDTDDLIQLGAAQAAPGQR